MKYFLLALTMAGLFACGQSSQNDKQHGKNQDYLKFEYSKDIASMDVRDPANWCNANFGDVALISADPKNYYRRLFALSDVPIKVYVELAQKTATFMLAKSGNQVEIYTSDNLPACLSNKGNFQINPDGLSLQYNNKMDINFNVYLQEFPSGTQIALDLPAKGGYGLTVVRCSGCK